MKWTEILKQEWELRPCWSGVGCWCRRICTKSGTEIVDGARIDKDIASYFAALHNAFLREEILNYEKFTHITFYDHNNDRMIGVNECEFMNKWKVNKCGVSACPCRLIDTQDGCAIVNAGSIDLIFAKYIVKLHNSFAKERKKEYNKVAKRIKK